MTGAVLEIRGLTRRFGALTAVDGVDLDLRPGEVHALIGPNGAGKSTLIGMVAGWIKPDAGTVRLAGRDITGLSPAARARAGLGRSFQVSQLAMPLSARAHAETAALGAMGGAFSLGLGRGARAVAALGRAGIADRADTPVAQLSHGERRLVEIAAALALSPRLFLLDEPMAGLGAEGSAALTRLLAGLKAEAPILLVEHDMDAVFRLADRITVLERGRVLFTGNPDETRASREVQAAYLGGADG